MAIAKVFRTGRSQAIRLPKEFRVDVDKVHLKRTAEAFLVITKEPWEVFSRVSNSSPTTSSAASAFSPSWKNGIDRRALHARH
jgi:virulence-associated protein VagC